VLTERGGVRRTVALDTDIVPVQGNESLVPSTTDLKTAEQLASVEVLSNEDQEFRRGKNL